MDLTVGRRECDSRPDITGERFQRNASYQHRGNRIRTSPPSDRSDRRFEFVLACRRHIKGGIKPRTRGTFVLGFWFLQLCDRRRSKRHLLFSVLRLLYLRLLLHMWQRHPATRIDDCPLSTFANTLQCQWRRIETEQTGWFALGKISGQAGKIVTSTLVGPSL